VFIMFLKQLLAIFPFLFGGLFRWKPLVNLEDSMGMTRYRNSVAGAFVLPFILIASRYELLPIRFAADFEPGLKTLAVLAAFAAYMILRAIAIEVLVPKKISHDTYRLANRTLYDFLILGGLGQFIGVSVGVAFGLNDLTVNRILFYTFVVFFVLFLVRRTQILRNECNQFTAFLYLCALEILPVAIVVAVALFA